MDEPSDLDPLVGELFERRKRNGLTIREVARRMGVSTMTLRRIEGAEVSPNLRLLQKYAQALASRIAWELEDVEVPHRVAPDSRVLVDWGLDEPMKGTVRGVYGSPTRLWIQVELDVGPVVDIPAKAAKPLAKKSQKKR